MTVEHIHLVKRTIYVSECSKCGDKDIKDDNPPRERKCQKCGEWTKYVEDSWTGPDKFK